MNLLLMGAMAFWLMGKEGTGLKGRIKYIPRGQSIRRLLSFIPGNAANVSHAWAKRNDKGKGNGKTVLFDP
jgi:hypothetical protein